ncbi:MAG: chromate transporter [Ruminococcaceae bacterium]|nr:chromate transporter [Oscillospiraceae bacterium]
MILFHLFLGFLKVGCFAFGGAYGAIPLIRDVVLSYGWLDDEALTYMIAVSESTPGPIMVNLATYVGSSQAGIMGAAVATLAVVLPAFALIILLTALLGKVMEYRGVKAVVAGLSACVIGIILAAGITMMVPNIYSANSGIDVRAAFITALLILAMTGYRRLAKKKMSPILLILISAILGVLLYAV